MHENTDYVNFCKLFGFKILFFVDLLCYCGVFSRLCCLWLLSDFVFVHGELILFVWIFFVHNSKTVSGAYD